MHSRNPNWRKERNFDRKMYKFERSFGNAGRSNDSPYGGFSRPQRNDSRSQTNDYGNQSYDGPPRSQWNNYGNQSDDGPPRSQRDNYSNQSYDGPPRSQRDNYGNQSYNAPSRFQRDNYGNQAHDEASGSQWSGPGDQHRGGPSRSQQSDYGNQPSDRPSYSNQSDYGNSSRFDDEYSGPLAGGKPKNERHPAHLRGKDIGLWYRDKNAGKGKTKRMAKKLQKQSVPLELPDDKIQAIRSYLDEIGIAAPPTVTQIRMNNESVSSNVEYKYQHLNDSVFKRKFLNSITETIEEKMMQSANHPRLFYQRNREADEMYANELDSKEKDETYLEILKFRNNLPAFSKKNELLELLDTNQVVLVSGETGCGKTTQVPQFILDHEIESNRGSTCHIICTQPRRISAISVAERVAHERSERIGNSVGYQIRLERVMPRSTGSILFCTTGILLQIMQDDPAVRNASHIILDEVHERDILSDFAITVLRDVIKVRKELKIILMSATLNAEHFSEYYDNCPRIHIPGFTFPVTEYYLEDVLEITGVFRDKSRKKPKPNKQLKKNKKYQKYLEILEPYLSTLKNKKGCSNEIIDYLLSVEAEDVNIELIFHLTAHICNKMPPGAILIFLPGWERISALSKRMKNSGNFPENKYLIIPLHSAMPTVTQKSIFERPPHGKRKIVMATNIAETSITIDDIVYVIDCGFIKIKDFDLKLNVTTLKEQWVSLANAQQRKGRAGRVQAGICYHLFTRSKQLVLDSYQLPEMLRTRLEEVILQLKILQLGKAESFLQKVLDPPPEQVVQLSLELLISMNALDSDENLTPLGYHLAKFPVDPHSGKMLLLGSLFGCLDPITSIAASLSFKDAFVVPLGKEKIVDRIKFEMSKGSKSDHILMAEVMNNWRIAVREGKGRDFTSKNFLSYNNLIQLNDMKKQFIDHLYEMKFIDQKNVESPTLNRNSDNQALIRSMICAGLYPNIAVVRTNKRGKGRKLFTLQDGKIGIHPKSVLYGSSRIEGGFLAYYLKMKTNTLLMFDCSMIFPIALIFFCHSFTVTDRGDDKLIIVNDSMCFTCQPAVASIILELRAWLDWLLEHKIANPGTIDWKNNSDETLILEAIILLLTYESHLYLPNSVPQNYDFHEDEDDDDEMNAYDCECDDLEEDDDQN